MITSPLRGGDFLGGLAQEGDGAVLTNILIILKIFENPLHVEGEFPGGGASIKGVLPFGVEGLPRSFKLAKNWPKYALTW